MPWPLDDFEVMQLSRFYSKQNKHNFSLQKLLHNTVHISKGKTLFLICLYSTEHHTQSVWTRHNTTLNSYTPVCLYSTQRHTQLIHPSLCVLHTTPHSTHTPQSVCTPHNATLNSYTPVCPYSTLGCLRIGI